MPPRLMDCSGSTGWGCLYVHDGDGKLVPFVGIQEVQEIRQPEVTLEIEHEYLKEILEPYSAEMTLQLTHKSARKLRQQIHAMLQKGKRDIRRRKRSKEQERRNQLKRSVK